MRRSLAILDTLALRPDIRAAAAVASILGAGAATWWWCARQRRRRGILRLLSRLEPSASRERALAALRRAVAGLHKTALRAWLGPPQAAGRLGEVVSAPGAGARGKAQQWYYRLASGTSPTAFGALLISFDRAGHVLSVALVARR